MRARALVHIAGPTAAGKTTFVERLLDAKIAFVICVRAKRSSNPQDVGVKKALARVKRVLKRSLA